MQPIEPIIQRSQYENVARFSWALKFSTCLLSDLLNSNKAWQSKQLFCYKTNKSHIDTTSMTSMG